jgi:hypothetical protein
VTCCFVVGWPDLNRRPLRPELQAPLGVCPLSQLAECADGRRRWRLCGDVAVLPCCTVYRISSCGGHGSDRFRLAQRGQSVLPGRHRTALNCNPDCNLRSIGTGLVSQDRWLLVVGWADVPHRSAVVRWLGCSNQDARLLRRQSGEINRFVPGKAADLLMMVTLLFRRGTAVAPAARCGGQAARYPGGDRCGAVSSGRR